MKDINEITESERINFQRHLQRKRDSHSKVVDEIIAGVVSDTKKRLDETKTKFS